MITLVKFSMTEGTVDEDNRQDYLLNIINEFVTSGDILSIIPYYDYEDSTKPCDSSEDDIFTFRVTHLIEDKEHMFELEFSFRTYTASNQLSVEIMSDSFIPSVGRNKSYLERLKEILSKRLGKEWKKCIWIYDKESEVFSSALYPHIHETENLFRQLINELMVTIKGANWWDIVVPKSLKEKMFKSRNTEDSGMPEKEKNKVATYKSVAPAFQHIEEKLLLVEVGDLLRIATLKVKALTNINSAKVNAMINGMEEIDVNALLSELSNASTVTLNLWDECFSKYLSEDFKRNFRLFESNRNHIAHNKMIDKQAYDSILNSINLVRDELKNAIKKFHNEVLPAEVIRIIEMQEQFEEAEAEIQMEEIIESESGVERRHSNEIYELFEEKIRDFYYELEEELKFRNDIRLTDFNSLKYKQSEQELFSIEYKLDGRLAVVSCRLDIDDSWGGKSEMALQIELDDAAEIFDIEYINGDYDYNDDQGYYVPLQEDEFGQFALDSAKNNIVEFIEEHFENLREKIDAMMYRIIKEGDSSPVADIPCCECGEEYICVNESIAEFGRCLNCGEMNEICICERCGNYCEDNGKFPDDELAICDNCWEDFEEE